jgi:hypothetical protein
MEWWQKNPSYCPFNKEAKVARFEGIRIYIKKNTMNLLWKIKLFHF